MQGFRSSGRAQQGMQVAGRRGCARLVSAEHAGGTGDVCVICKFHVSSSLVSAEHVGL